MKTLKACTFADYPTDLGGTLFTCANVRGAENNSVAKLYTCVRVILGVTLLTCACKEKHIV